MRDADEFSSAKPVAFHLPALAEPALVRGTQQFLLAVCLPLFVALALAKAAAHGSWEWWSIRFPLKCAIVSFCDLLFVLGWGVIGALSEQLFHRRPRTLRVARGIFIGISILLVVYGTASVWIYSALRMPTSWQGSSLLDSQRSPRCYFSCNTGALLMGLREKNEKFIYNVTLGREELYDLAADPAEQLNLAPQRAGECRVYRQRLTAWSNFERAHLDSLAATQHSP